MRRRDRTLALLFFAIAVAVRWLYIFEVRALVDGGLVATELDDITVTPEPSAVALFGLGSLLVSRAVRRRARP